MGNQRTLPDSGQRTLECGHKVLYPNVPPKVGAKVWCTRCDRPRRVAAATKRGDAA